MSKNEELPQTTKRFHSGLTDSKGRILLAESERTRTEVWTRVMGYHRPISAFNPGKQSEHAERIHFKESCVHSSP